MRAKSVLLLLIALGCGIVASVAVSQVVLDQKNRGEVQTMGILVVAKDLSAATKIPPDAFKLEQWPIERVPIGAITDPKSVENKFTKQRLYVGEPIIEAKLSGKGKEFSVPVGFRIFDIVVKDESGGSGYIGPGDHVDVFGYFEKGARINAAKSVKVMENLEVVMIDGVAVVDPEATTQKKSSTIQLLVRDSQYVVLDTAANLGKLRLALRPPEQAGNTDSVTDDGQSFMDWLKESEAAQAERRIAEPTKVSPLQSPTATSIQEDLGMHEMLIVSANKSVKYRMQNGQMIPQASNKELGNGVSGREYQNMTSAAQNNQAIPIPPANSFTQPSKSTQSSGSEKTTEAANPAETSTNWDSGASGWQSGGFKPIYPNEK
jgi:pilus assembly protein CpaB